MIEEATTQYRSRYLGNLSGKEPQSPTLPTSHFGDGGDRIRLYRRGGDDLGGAAP